MYRHWKFVFATPISILIYWKCFLTNTNIYYKRMHNIQYELQENYTVSLLRLWICRMPFCLEWAYMSLKCITTNIQYIQINHILFTSQNGPTYLNHRKMTTCISISISISRTGSIMNHSSTVGTLRSLHTPIGLLSLKLIGHIPSSDS